MTVVRNLIVSAACLMLAGSQDQMVAVDAFVRAEMARLLGALARKVSGRFYGDVLRDGVFLPHRAAGYHLEDGALKNQGWVSPELNTTADGSLYLSLCDMVAWDAGLRARQLPSIPR